MKHIHAIILLLAISTSAHAGLVSDIKVFLRPKLVMIIGVEKTNKLLGEDLSAIVMPTIPEIEKDARSTVGFGEAPKNSVEFEKDQIARFNYVFLKEVFEATRKSTASEGELSKWMNVLSQNGSREGVYRALVLDSVYLGLENYDTFLNEDSVNFTMDYLSRFLDKTVSRKALESANFYTVKRDITERSLEVIDEYLRKEGDEVYNWYALFSAKLAEDYPEAMNNKTRKDIDPARHKLWSKSVPDQFIKSEVIIKLHRVFNSIQG